MIIKALSETDREAICDHYATLDAKDIRNRFGSTVGMDSVRAYIKHIDMKSNHVFGAFIDHKLVGLLEMAWYEKDIELAFTVNPEYRNRHIATALFDFAINESILSGAKKIHLHIDSANLPMKKLAMNKGWKSSQNNGGQMIGTITLFPKPQNDFPSMEMKAA